MWLKKWSVSDWKQYLDLFHSDAHEQTQFKNQLITAAFGTITTAPIYSNRNQVLRAERRQRTSSIKCWNRKRTLAGMEAVGWNETGELSRIIQMRVSSTDSAMNSRRSDVSQIFRITRKSRLTQRELIPVKETMGCRWERIHHDATRKFPN